MAQEKTWASDEQRKAMQAAAAGRGNLGIPTRVARKFVKHKSSKRKGVKG